MSAARSAAVSRKLTRRANHRHIVIIAEITNARAGKPAAGFLLIARRCFTEPLGAREPAAGVFESGSGCRHISFVPPHFRSPVCRAGLKEIAMKKLLVAAVIAGSFFSFEASAQERAGSAALGAVSGAIVLGPIGAVAGAFIGYSAGPAIAHSWGIGRSASPPRGRRAAQANPETREQATTKAASPPAAKAPEVVAARKIAPPVQGFELTHWRPLR